MRNEKTIVGKLIAQKKITLPKAAELTGITYATIIHLAYKQFDLKEIKVDTLLRLCVGLNVKAIDLFPEEEKDLVKRLSRKSRKKSL